MVMILTIQSIFRVMIQALEGIVSIMT